MAGKQDKDKNASYKKPLSIPDELFVLRSLCTDRKTHDMKSIYDHLKEDGDTTDMSSSGYTLTVEETPEICADNFGDYQWMEYYDGPLGGKHAALEPVSRYLTGEVDFLELFMAYDGMRKREKETARKWI